MRIRYRIYPSKYSQREAKHTEASTWTPLTTPSYDLENYTYRKQAKIDENARFSHMKAVYDLLQGTGLVRIIFILLDFVKTPFYHDLRTYMPTKF